MVTVEAIARIATIAFVSLVSAASPASAASYEEARDAFDSTLSFEQRIAAEILLDAAGFAPVVPTAHLSRQAYQAVLAFERADGFAASGIVTAPKIKRLGEESASYLRDVGFREVAYPGSRQSIWVPLGLGLDVTRDATGLHFHDGKGRLTVDMISVAGDSIQVAHDREIAEERAHEATIRDDDFRAGDRWFAIASTWPDGSDHHIRLYQDGSSVTGFALAWRKSGETLNPEAIAAIMSGSLRATILDEPFVTPPKVETPEPVARGP